VILAQEITTLDAYVACDRPGLGAGFARSRRPVVWRAVSQVAGELSSRGKSTFYQLADEAAHFVGASPQPRYDHVIVDEGQDLHSSQWRLLRALAAPGADDLFIAGDPHQRIYDSRVSLNKLGIHVRGRSSRLKLNYRTTQEILAWSVPLLGFEPVADLDGGVDTLAGYRSPMHGRRPAVHAFGTRDGEIAGLVTQVRSWIDEGIEPEAIGVAARKTSLGDAVREALKEAGIKATSLHARGPAVRVGTMHKMKGLEFRCVVVLGVDDDVIPAPSAVASKVEDPIAHAHDLQRERCLLFVACTRARDHLYLSHTGPPSQFLPSSPAPSRAR
jgi:superfamily I DNA/RNA helicase